MKKTNNELLTEKLLQQFEQLLNNYENDIESGIGDGSYAEDDNIENRQFIQECHQTLKDFSSMFDEVLVFVSGGLVKAMNATKQMKVSVFDKDNYDNGDESERADFVTVYGDPVAWDQMIQKRTEENEIIGIY